MAVKKTLKLLSFAEEAQKTLEESMAMSIDERQELALELYRSRHGGGTISGTISGTGTIGRRTIGTLGRKSTHPNPAAASLGKSPPRPSPASVAYHSDEESLKCYDENPDDSSVTEKPSEVSSSDSQVFSWFIFKFTYSEILITLSIVHSTRKVKMKVSGRIHIRLSIIMQM